MCHRENYKHGTIVLKALALSGCRYIHVKNSQPLMPPDSSYSVSMPDVNFVIIIPTGELIQNIKIEKNECSRMIK